MNSFWIVRAMPIFKTLDWKFVVWYQLEFGEYPPEGLRNGDHVAIYDHYTFNNSDAEFITVHTTLSDKMNDEQHKVEVPKKYLI